MTVLTWKPEHDAQLKTCRNNNLSFAESAADIISRASRLGFPKEEKRVSASKGGKATAKRIAVSRPKPSKPTPLPDIPSSELAIEPDELEEIDLPGGAPALITVLDLKAHHCRFPFGEGPFHFCGKHRREKFPYCSEHIVLTHNLDGRRA
jgi:hypothetical protein